MNPKRILADVSIFARGYLRNPAALFFSLIFPIILIGLFGLIFSTAGNSAITLYTVNLDGNSVASQQFIQALDNTSAVHVTLKTGIGNLSKWLAANGNPVGLVIPAGFNASYTTHRPVFVTVYTDPQDSVSSGIVVGAVNGVVTEFNYRAASSSPIVFVSQQTVGSNVFKYIDYLVPGLIGFSILTSPMFSMVDIAATYRKEGLFRQLSLTPLTKSEWLAAKIIWYVILSAISAGIMVAFGDLVFGAHIAFSPLLIPFLFFGPFFFVALGMLSGSVAKTPESAAIIGNIVTFPMMFLSGTFFPVSSFPAGLQLFAHILPLYYVIDGMNQVVLFANLARAAVDLAVIAAGSVVVFVLAVIAFKWRDE